MNLKHYLNYELKDINNVKKLIVFQKLEFFGVKRELLSAFMKTFLFYIITNKMDLQKF